MKPRIKKAARLFDAREHKQSMERFVHLNGRFIAQGSLHRLDGAPLHIRLQYMVRL